MAVRLAASRNPLVDSVMDAMAADEQERLERIMDAWAAYEGDHPETLVSDGRVNDNLPVNFCRMAVNKGVSYLFGEDVSFEVRGSERDEAGEPSNPEAQAEDWLEDAWQDNLKMSTLKQMAVNGGVAGHAFLRLDLPQPGMLYPKVRLLDPSYVSVAWEPHDYTDVYRYRIQFTDYNREGRLVLFRQLIERNENGLSWTIEDQVSDAIVAGDTSDPINLARYVTTWRTITTQAWPYAFPPVFGCQNLPAANVYWGTPDLTDDVVRLNYGMDALVSNAMKIIRNHAHPRTVARGVTQDQMANIPNDPERMITLPRAEQDIKNLEMTSDLSSTIVLFQNLREAFHEVTRIPEVAVGRLDNVGALSGIALKILYGPLEEQTSDKRLTYGKALMDCSKAMMVVGGIGGADEMRLSLHWPEVVPEDPATEAQNALLLKDLGVSRDTLLERLGFDPDLEAEKRAVEADEAEATFERMAAAPPGAGLGLGNQAEAAEPTE